VLFFLDVFVGFIQKEPVSKAFDTERNSLLTLKTTKDRMKYGYRVWIGLLWPEILSNRHNDEQIESLKEKEFND
jgi:hypothetical protein